MTLSADRTRGWSNRLFWTVMIVMMLGLAGFGAFGVWSMVHWPWDRWGREAARRDEQAARATRTIYAEALAASRTPSQTPRREIGPSVEVITNPFWTVRPGGEYPQLAQDRGVESGAVQLECEGLASGQLGACEILSETPTGAGFGEAALAGTRQARLQPRSVDGYQTDFTVRFTVRFLLR
ncbi:hypothetical protein BH10PSE2_BH10PSE2_30120 [soil metagenome]